MQDNELPTLANCDPNNPAEVFLPFFMGLPDVIGAMLVFPIKWWRKVSAHLVDCGVMIQCPQCGHREDPKKKFRIDATEDPMMGGGGRWVPADEPDPEKDVLAERLDAIRPQIKKEMLRRLREEFPDDPGLRDGGAS
ncbi:phage gene 29 protein family protein [Rhodococcus sp. SJ-2]